MTIKHTLLALLLFVFAQTLGAQPKIFNQMFHPQNEYEIEVMKRSPQKMVITYSVSEDVMGNDSANYIKQIKKYDALGRLILVDDYGTGNKIKYSYDNKGRVSEYFEDNGIEGAQLYFAISYTKKGAIENVQNKAQMGKSVSYNAATKTLLISETGGYIYRYTLNDKGQPTEIKTEFFMSVRYNATLTYDKKGLLVEIKGAREQGEGAVDFTTTYTYQNGKLQRETDVFKQKNNPTEYTVTTTYNYNSNNQPENKLIEQGETKTAFVYFYDAAQRPTQTNYFEGDEMLAQEFYVYR